MKFVKVDTDVHEDCAGEREEGESTKGRSGEVGNGMECVGSSLPLGDGTVSTDRTRGYIVLKGFF